MLTTLEQSQALKRLGMPQDQFPQTMWWRTAVDGYRVAYVERLFGTNFAGDWCTAVHPVDALDWLRPILKQQGYGFDLDCFGVWCFYNERAQQTIEDTSPSALLDAVLEALG